MKGSDTCMAALKTLFIANGGFSSLHYLCRELLACDVMAWPAGEHGGVAAASGHASRRLCRSLRALRSFAQSLCACCTTPIVYARSLACQSNQPDSALSHK